MVPVELRLRNFLSYGEAAPPLSFEGLRVAVLSGGNGQGKSALLDAITWAVWGEARKSADSRKPDEELLRVGQREMEVDLTFRLSAGGGRDTTLYRIARRFTQTASGKTSKPGLEFQVRDGDDWRTLTAESVRATQAAIDARLGIDYETFVNSTFLLQGRSDEFTKKKPGERKEILGKILGLDRYDRLAARAGARWTILRDEAARLEADAERLVAALEPESEWQAARAVVQETIERLTAEAAEARAEEAAAARALDGLDAAAREADAARAALDVLDTRRRVLADEVARLDARIAEADALVARADTIEADHARYEALRAERSTLDERATLFRGLDGQRQALLLELQGLTKDAELDLESRRIKLEALQKEIAADEARVRRHDEVRQRVAAAEQAAATFAALDRVRKERRHAEDGIALIDKKLAEAKGTLDGHIARLRDEVRRLKDALAVPDTADASGGAEALRQRAADGRAAEAEMERVRDEGTALAARVQALDAALVRADEDVAALVARRARIETATDETCPTCATPLTETHRAEVARSYTREIDALVARQATDRADKARLDAERAALRHRFVALKARVTDGQAAAEALAGHAQREAQREADRSRLAEVTREGAAARAALEAEDYAHDLRAERARLDDVLSQQPFDEAAYEAARETAAGRAHSVRELTEIEVAAERLARNRSSAERAARDVAERSEALARGDHAVAGRTRLDALARQIASVGYDAEAHERVSRDLDRLAGAPAALAALLTARRTLAESTERRAEAHAETASADAEAVRLTDTLAALAERLAARDAALAARDAAHARRETLAAALAEAQATRGGLDERLARAAADRARLDTVRRELREAKQQRTLYGHLRRAFSKNGIPSLIVEETLPEVEERANRLLDRLSGGRTRVALETLKDKKTGGGTKETLDIRITDAEGQPRAYEMYSGGEAFRVNFALRIALSQMLAERSGTRIRTLVVDEGFGTQDKDGLQALVGAIHAIQDDFDLILVITHLDELKAAFPVRIEVRKEPVTGSTFDVIGE